MKFLIVSLRYLGDCLLAAALAPALKARFPDAQIDMLTFKDNAPILEGIQDISHVIGVEHHPNKFVQACSHLASWNKYDWALITMNSTRTVLYGYFAAKHQVMVRPYLSLEELWKRILITDQIDFVGGLILERTQPLLGPLFKGTAPKLCPIFPDRELSTDLQARLHMLGPYVVCQCNSRYQDKNWSIEKWIELAHLLMTAGYGLCFTGGPGDVDYLLKITEALPPQKIFIAAGHASFGQTSRIIMGAVAYIGVDTATSHIAAATGIPCVCLYGPTHVDAWGPAPKCGQSTPYSNKLDIQTVGNVTIVRRNNTDIPCSGCTRHLCAHYNPPQLSRCMQSISVEKVWNALCCHTPIGSTLL